jgi:hypothetical protein
MPERTIPPERDALDRECRVFCRFLVGQRPSSYVLAKYHEAHVTCGLRNPQPALSFDAVLLRIGRAHPWLTRLADVYGRFLLPASHLRVKLVVLLAILESCAPTEARFRLSQAGYLPVVYARLLLYGIGYAISVPASLLLFLPVHAICTLLTRGRARRPAHSAAALERP